MEDNRGIGFPSGSHYFDIEYAPSEILLCSFESRNFISEFAAMQFHFIQLHSRPVRDSNSGHRRERAAFLASELTGLALFSVVLGQNLEEIF